MRGYKISPHIPYKRHNENGQEVYNSHKINEERKKKINNFLESCDKNNREKQKEWERKYNDFLENYNKTVASCPMQCPARMQCTRDNKKFFLTREEWEEMLRIDSERPVLMQCTRDNKNFLLTREEWEELQRIDSNTDQSDALIDLFCTNDLSSRVRVHASYLVWRYNTNAWIQRSPFLQPSAREEFSMPADRNVIHLLGMVKKYSFGDINEQNLPFVLLKNKYDCDSDGETLNSKHRTMFGAYGISYVNFCHESSVGSKYAEKFVLKKQFLLETTFNFEEPAWVDLQLLDAYIVNPFSFFVGVGGFNIHSRLVLQY
jgi:hypothetical protein